MATSEILAILLMCAPQVHPVTMQALIAAESDFQVHAIHVNGSDADQPPQPQSPTEAIALLESLMAQGKSVDVGLGQINSANFDVLGLTPQTAFDPCTNIEAAGRILTENFQRAATRLEGDAALLAALSAYNTGNESGGFRNGYVERVQRKAAYAVPALPAAPSFHTSRTPSESTKPAESPVRLTRANTEAEPWSPYGRAEAKTWDVYGRQ